MDEWTVQQARYNAEIEKQRPFYMLLPRVIPDGDMWCALYGENLQEGVAGFGPTPEAAAHAFDQEWWHGKALKAHASREGRA